MKKRVCIQRTDKERIELLKKYKSHPDWTVEDGVRELGIKEYTLRDWLKLYPENLDEVLGSDRKRKKGDGRKRKLKPYELRVVEYFDNLREHEWSFDDLLFYCRSLDEFRREYTNPRSQVSWVRRFIKRYNPDYSSQPQVPSDTAPVEQEKNISSDADVDGASEDSSVDAAASPAKPPPPPRKPSLRKRMQPLSLLLKWSREGDEKELFIFLEDVDSLRPLQRLTATVIDYFIARYMIRVPGLVYTCSSTIYRSIEAGHAQKHDKATRYDSLRGSFDWQSYPYILLPICTEDHWSFAVVENALREGPTGLFLVTSKKGAPNSLEVFKSIKSYLFNERYVRTNVAASCEWRYGVFDTKPQQRNEVDCGIYLLYYMDVVSRNLAEKQLVQESSVKDNLAVWTVGGFNMTQVEERRASMLKRLQDDIKNVDLIETATV